MLRTKPAGFTLIEVIMVIVIIGIISTSIAMFIRLPVQGAVDTSRRAAMVDTADLALQRLQREIRTALPNSVRVFTSGAGTSYIEFLPTLAGGRYCAEPNAGGVCSSAAGSASNALDFTSATETSFEIIGPLVAPASFNASGASVAVYNLGIPGADAYNSDNTSPLSGSGISGTTAKTVTFSAKLFPLESPGKRFHIIGSPVSYVCSAGSSGNNGTGSLVRYSGYAKQAAQPTSFAGASQALLATTVSACSIDYTQAVIARDGLLSIRLQIKQAGDTVSLSHAIQIPNTP